MPRVPFLAILFSILLPSLASARNTHVDLINYNDSAVRIAQSDNHLRATWPIDSTHQGHFDLSLEPARPLITNISTQSTADGASDRILLHDITPCMVLTVGTRDLKPNGWTIYFDNPARRPWQSYPLTISRDTARVVTENGRTSIVLDNAIAGPFTGQYRFTFYPGSRLIRASAILSTQRESTAILYDPGLSVPAGSSLPLKSIAFTALDNQLTHIADISQIDAHPLQIRNRVMIAESPAGSLALLPPPHQYFYPVDTADNYSFAWLGRDYRSAVPGCAFGLRQSLEADHRYAPWINAPPNSLQDLSVFYLLSNGDAAQATAEVLAYTHNDTFLPLDGYKTFTSHYHVEHTVDFLTRQKRERTTGIPAETKGSGVFSKTPDPFVYIVPPELATPPFVTRFKQMGVDAVHLAEFHLAENDMKIADRLTRLQTLHAECARLSDNQFLLIPGEEPNVHLGGHWLSLFPRPVYWTLTRSATQPFSEDIAPYGKVYHVGSAADVLHLMQAEHGLMWTAHPRIKASTGFPDLYKHTDFFASDQFLGGAWKPMPADNSIPRLGTRVLDLLDDMNNWNAHKQSPGEVDIFKIDQNSELYPHMNINYLHLHSLPTFSDGWQPILNTLRSGQFFTTTGEILIPTFTLDDKQSGDSLTPPSGPSHLHATVTWTFPLTFADVITGDGRTTTHHPIDLHDTVPFGSHTLDIPIDLHNQTWARFEVWDIATNGAYTQPIWIQ